MSRKYWPVALENFHDVDFSTNLPGVLRVGPEGMSASFRLEFHSKGTGQSRDVVACITHLADREGMVWETQSLFTPRVFMDKWLALTELLRPCFLATADKDWQKLFKKPLLLAGVKDFYDDRFYRRFLVERAVIDLQFKYIAPQYDIAYLNQHTLLVRVRKLWASWTSLRVGKHNDVIGVVPLKEENKEKTWGDFDELLPIVFCMNTRDLLFRNCAYQDPEFPEIWGDNQVPLPLCFRRTSKKGERQMHVRFIPFTELKRATP